MDGNPFEVAERAVRQAQAMAQLLIVTLSGANVMARNAEMERDLMRSGECDAKLWPETAQGRRYAALLEDARTMEKALGALTLAAGYNPKKALNA